MELNLVTSDWILALFLFALGACVGSFLNVVVWRLPRGESIVSPPSHCPHCNHRLSWRDNIPVLGWLLLKGKCRYCRAGISPRYPLVEFLTGALFVFYFLMFFQFQIGPCPPVGQFRTDEFGLLQPARALLDFHRDWPIYLLYMLLIGGLLAASLVDAELYVIPIQIPWCCAAAGVVVHALIDQPDRPGALNINPTAAAMALAGALGTGIAVLLLKIGLLKTSFAQGEPLLEVDRAALAQAIEAARAKGEVIDLPPLPPDYSRRQIRLEIGHEILFLAVPLALAALAGVAVMKVESIRAFWEPLGGNRYVAGASGAILGALWGGLVVWLTRILGTLGFGRIAMGLGDVHLMVGVGAVIGAGAVTVAFFLAPMVGILFAVYRLLARSGKEIPYGPFLAGGTALTMLFYCPIAEYLKPGWQGLTLFMRQMAGPG